MVLLLVSSILITLVEPQGTELTHFGDALWWSIVTSTTVGYGDLYPVSTGGRIVATILPIFMGIGLGAAFITHIASYLIERRDKKMHGEKFYKGSNHILLVGYTEETQCLVEQIQKDENYARRNLVLLSNIPRHPLPELTNLIFVQGQPDTIGALTKANIAQADQIIIHTGSDEKSLFALINALRLKNDTCEVTVRCLSSQALYTFSSIPGKFETIMQMTAEMMVQAMQDKVHIPLQILLRNEDDNEEIYYVTIPEILPNPTWWNLHNYLKEKYEYLSFALKKPDGKVMVNPPGKEPVSKGCGIWLIALNRPMNLTWPD
ncbi:MAG: potassium channel protein [Desulfobacteraceae bacterium]|nr:potassium channel protein [Desulfobacteraceae bacterium]